MKQLFHPAKMLSATFAGAKKEFYNTLIPSFHENKIN